MNNLKLLGITYPLSCMATGVSMGGAITMVGLRGTDLRFPLVLTASSAFVFAGIAGQGWRHPFGRHMILGLFLCCLGDVVGSWNFFGGAFAFLAAHVAFIIAIWRQGVQYSVIKSIPIALLITVAGGILLLWLLPHVPDSEKGFVVVYISIISLLVLAAASIRLKKGSALFLIGTLLFYLSDIFVARWRYIHPSPINAWFCYPLYYAACNTLALCIALCSLNNYSNGADEDSYQKVV